MSPSAHAARPFAHEGAIVVVVVDVLVEVLEGVEVVVEDGLNGRFGPLLTHTIFNRAPQAPPGGATYIFLVRRSTQTLRFFRVAL